MSTLPTVRRTSRALIRCCARASARSSSRMPVSATPRWRETISESTRIYVTGSCDGLDRLREGLAAHPELDFVGWSENVSEASAALAGGHLQVVVHATRSATFPATSPEHTRSPIVILASGESSALLEEALDAEGVADVLLLPQLTENVVSRSGRRATPAAVSRPRRSRLSGPHHHRVLAEGRNARPSWPRTSQPRSRSTRAGARSCSISTCSRRCRDHARPRAGQDDLRPRCRPG